MRALRWIVISCLILLPLLLVSTILLLLEEQPRVQRTVVFTPENIERARRIIDKNDPRKMPYGVLGTMTVNEADVDLAANYLVNRYCRGSARMALKDGNALLEASLPVPHSGRYLNIKVVLTETAALPQVASLRLGRLSVPGWGADRLLAWGLARLNQHERYSVVGEVIKQVRITAEQLSIVYTWQADLPDKLRAAVVSRDDQERLRAYHDRLGEAARALPAKRISLTEVLPPLAQLARQRARHGDPVEENRAWLLVLTLYVNRKGLAAIVPAAQDWPRLPVHAITLNGRKDFPLHFTISAALAARAGGALADAIGLYKEVDDSRAGSGFSFNDIAADRAGTRFGELAAGTRETAILLQQRLSAGVRERDLMPATDDLPEFMPEAEFLRRFGGIGAPAYQQMMATIERRLAMLAFYKVP